MGIFLGGKRLSTQGRRNQKISATTMMENVLGNNGLNKTKDSAETKDKKIVDAITTKFQYFDCVVLSESINLLLHQIEISYMTTSLLYTRRLSSLSRRASTECCPRQQYFGPEQKIISDAFVV
eukprot:scaffold3010_cov198-Alexandrium_tamarense.AAC.26